MMITFHSITLLLMLLNLIPGGGGFRCLCRVQNIACYRMRMGIIGDQFVHSVADDLNIYYEQFSCVGTPKFQFHIDRISLE